MNLFFTDAETDGLYGPFLSVAVLVTDESGKEVDSFYGAVDVSADEICSPWVKENVLGHLKNARSTYKSEYALLEAFWETWMKHKASAFAVGDVIYPVEARLFSECVSHDPAGRELLAPFPFLDLSTLLAARGLDPLADRQQLSGLSLTSHDAMNDVKMLSACWFKFIKE